jgi:hypothetical protein
MICAYDDDARCCGLCDVWAIMATRGRHDLVIKNLKYLRSLDIKTAVTVTGVEDYAAISPHATKCEIFPDHPLGAKWQRAADMALKENPQLLVTVGSDDFIGPHLVDNARKKIQAGYRMTGVSEWFMYDTVRRVSYRAGYSRTPDFPVGSGRVFSQTAINALGGRLFVADANRRLDDWAYINLSRKGPREVYVSRDTVADGMEVLAVKGEWEQLNPIHKFFNAPTIRIEPVELPEIFKPLCAEYQAR